MKAQSILATSCRTLSGRTGSRIQISTLLIQCSLQSHYLCKRAHKGDSRSPTVFGCCYFPILLGLFFLYLRYKPSCTQFDASVMTQVTPKDEESFTKVIHCSLMREEGAWDTLLSFTFKPLVCLSVCLEESTVITPLMYDLISGAGAAALLRNNKSHKRLPRSLPWCLGAFQFNLQQ